MLYFLAFMASAFGTQGWEIGGGPPACIDDKNIRACGDAYTW